MHSLSGTVTMGQGPTTDGARGDRRHGLQFLGRHPGVDGPCPFLGGHHAEPLEHRVLDGVVTVVARDTHGADPAPGRLRPPVVYGLGWRRPLSLEARDLPA